jgi:hypothetical protein
MNDLSTTSKLGCLSSAQQLPAHSSSFFVHRRVSVDFQIIPLEVKDEDLEKKNQILSFGLGLFNLHLDQN